MEIIPNLASKIFDNLKIISSPPPPSGQQNLSIFAFIAVSPVVRNCYDRGRQWK